MDKETIYETILCPATKDSPRNSEADIIELKNGSLLLAYTGFCGGGSDDFSPARILGKISEDGGKSWSSSFTIQKNIARQNIMSASLLRLDSREIALFYGHKNSYTDLKHYMRKSFDEGKSWSCAVCVTPQSGYNVINNARMIQLSSGRLLAPICYTPDIDRPDWHVISTCFFSDDNGKTWEKSKTNLNLPKRGADEPGLVELKDGSVLMIIRTYLGRIYKSYSFDNGLTWSRPKPMDLVSPGSPATVKRIPSTGDLLIVWNNNYEPDTVGAGARTPLTVAISKDEGETWENFKNLESSARYRYAYTSITFVEKKVLFTYYVQEEVEWTALPWSLKLKIVDIDWLYA